jgi:imidazolonepropionase-like amidohydrolase
MRLTAMPSELAIRNVTVIDGTGAAPAAGVDVVVREGRFAAVGPGVAEERAGDGATVVVGDGRFLVPGLLEVHTHLRHELKDSEEASQAALDETLGAYLQRGITTVVDLGGRIEIYNRLRERHQLARAAGRARLLFAGANFTGINGWPICYHPDATSTYEIRDVAGALAALRSLLERSPDVIKIMYHGEPGAPDKLPREALEALVQEAHAHGRRALVHVRTALDSLHALDAGADGLEHSFLPSAGEEQAEAEQVTAALARNGAYLTPTLALWEQLGRAGDADYAAELAAAGSLAPAERDALTAPQRGWGQTEFPHHPKAECRVRLRVAFAMLPAMHAAGVKLVAGSDIATALSRPEAACREIVLLARAGVPLKDVLVAATRHAAEKVGRGATVGTIEVGKTADALLLDADPLGSVDNLVRREHQVATIKDGELYPQPG